MVRSLAVSCAAAEDLLRKMLESWDFSLEALLSAHLVNCSDARRALSTVDTKLRAVPPLVRAVEELEKALQTLNSYRYSTDPEYRHRTMFQSTALELVDQAKRFVDQAKQFQDTATTAVDLKKKRRPDAAIRQSVRRI